MSIVRDVFNRTVKPPYVATRGAVIGTLERRSGIRTEADITPQELGLSPEHQERYKPSHWSALRRILPLADVGPDDVFLDLGSGMGRVVYQAAARYPLRRVIGVELSERLHVIAEENIARTRERLRCRDIRLLCTDATRYEVPDDVTVVFLGNPFSGPVFAAVLEQIVASVRRNPRRLRLLYFNPVEEPMVLAAGFTCTKTLSGLRPGREWARSNSTRRYEIGPVVEPPITNREHWESIGANYTAEWAPPARSRLGELELEFIVEGLRRSPGRTALDVGIGSGRILDGLHRSSRETELWGIDLARAMVDATRARFADEPRVRELRVCDLAREPVPFAQEFDFISAIRMLKYNDDWRGMVAKLVAQLSPAGVIVFTMSNTRSLNAISRPYAIDGHDASRAQLRELCDELGLTVLAEEGFTKLPHFVYSRLRSPLPTRGVLAVDRALSRLVGGPAFAREVFVAARRS